MSRNVLYLTRTKWFVMFLLICLKNPSVFIRGIPIPGSGVIDNSVSDDFDQNPLDHTLPNTYEDEAVRPNNGDVIEDSHIETFDEVSTEKNNNFFESNDKTVDAISKETSYVNTKEGVQSSSLGNNMKGDTHHDPVEEKYEYSQHSKLKGDHSEKQEIDQTISKLEELIDDTDEVKSDPNQHPESILMQEKLSLQNIVSKFENLKKGNIPELSVVIKVKDESQQMDDDEHKTAHTEETDGVEKDTKKEGTEINSGENEKVGEQVERMSEEEKRMKLKEILDKLNEDHKALKKQSFSDIHNPPGLNIDKKRRRVILNNLRLLKSDKEAFELSANRKFNVNSKELNHKSTTSYQKVQHEYLMSTALVTASSRITKPKFRTDHELRRLVAEIRIVPSAEIGHSENPNFFQPSPPYVWSQAPSHYSYLGLIKTPDKFRTTALDKRILASYNVQVLKRLQAELGDDGWEQRKKPLVEEEDNKVQGEDLKRIEEEKAGDHGEHKKRTVSI